MPRTNPFTTCFGQNRCGRTTTIGSWAVYVRNIEEMVAELPAKARKLIAPGADDIQLYQPTHKLAYNL